MKSLSEELYYSCTLNNLQAKTNNILISGDCHMDGRRGRWGGQDHDMCKPLSQLETVEQSQEGGRGGGGGAKVFLEILSTQ